MERGFGWLAGTIPFECFWGYIGLVEKAIIDVTYAGTTASSLAIFGACNLDKEDDKMGSDIDPCELLS